MHGFRDHVVNEHIVVLLFFGIFGTHNGCAKYGNEVGLGMGVSDLWDLDPRQGKLAHHDEVSSEVSTVCHI